MSRRSPTRRAETPGPFATGARFEAILGPSRASRWRRLVLRRSLTLLLLVVAATVLLRDQGAAEATVEVVRARSSVPAGAVLDADDVEVARVAASAVATGSATDPTALTGRRTTAAILAGEVLSSARVVGPGALDGLPRGHRAVALPVDDVDSVRLISSGDRVDVLHPGRDGPVAADVLVLATPAADDDGSGIVPAGSAGHVVVAIPTQRTARLVSSVESGASFIFAARSRT